MIIPLLTLIGSAGSGKLIQMVSEIMSNASHAKQQKEDREFQKYLADKGALNEYLKETHAEVDGHPSLLSITLCSLYLMFGATVCAAALYCFYIGFGEVTIKDPDQAGSHFKFLLFEWKPNPKNISEISPMGLGYLILHPILFILSTVSGATRFRRR